MFLAMLLHAGLYRLPSLNSRQSPSPFVFLWSWDFVLFFQGLPVTVEPRLMTSLTLSYHVSEHPFCKCNHIQQLKDLGPSTYESGGRLGPQSAGNM